MLDSLDEGKGKIMNGITWLHLSDLHFSESQSYDANIVIKSLLKDIQKCISDDLIKPDFIIVSGDIANAGLPDEYEIAGKFFDELLDVTKIPKEKLFLIAGNHDVNRKVNPNIISGL